MIHNRYIVTKLFIGLHMRQNRYIITETVYRPTYNDTQRYIVTETVYRPTYETKQIHSN